ncbi:Tn7 transposase TnsA N-terminal domain-containing protein [Bacillus thuringiensis]|nr:Tn7 transposase TnsA N-terminal domain-containing protein [Bacillus cereus]MED2915266.1 Tn7 transposase TnsA N-terminal domain-containing protein [Bacillus thuringiensis]MED2922735.1 Tn7 transposase TnsA N-terminal domain-containing protein [Bacillus thuringiensis]MED3050903.1 Tn7 transposase TnsA N-terminal domain-containing protein [Bacillus thuringiensis]
MYKPIFTSANKKFGNNRWISYSSKLQREVFLFSDLEYEHWLIIESNPTIIDFCEQPLLMNAHINGKLMTSIVDMWVKYNTGQEEFIEIKYAADLTKQTVINQIAIQKHWCNEHRFQHRVKTEGHIRTNRMLLSNLKILVKGQKQQKQQLDTDRYLIMKILKSATAKIPLTFLIQETKLPQNRLFLSIGQMILNGEVYSNISQQYYGLNTEVWLNV